VAFSVTEPVMTRGVPHYSDEFTGPTTTEFPSRGAP